MANQAIYSLPRLPAAVALDVLADLVSQQGSNLIDRIGVLCRSDLNATIQLRTNHTRLGAAVDPAVEGLLYESFNRHPYNQERDAQLPRDLPAPSLTETQSRDPLQDIVGLIGFAIAASQTKLMLQSQNSALSLARPVEECAYILGPMGALSEVARSFARIEWRSNGMTVSSLGLEKSLTARPYDPEAMSAIACIGISPEWGGTQDIAFKYQEHFEANVDFRLAYQLASGVLLLKPGVGLETSIRDSAGQVLCALMAFAGLQGAVATGVDWSIEEDGIGTIKAMIADLPKVDVLPSVASQPIEDEGRSIEVEFLQLWADDNATSDLRLLLEKHASDIGHRLELQRMPQYADREDDLPEIDSQIDELSVRRDLILGEGAGDWRLLRFPAHALDALIDCLRRFRLETVDAGHVKYAFRASGIDRSGVHYLMFRLRDIGLEPAYPEAFWRDAVKAGTIVHRVDPLFAQFAVAKKARSLVFTPKGHVVVPNFRATQSNVDSYLQQGFEGFFDFEAVFSEAKTKSQVDRPIYLFGKSEEGKIRVEIMDAEQFVDVGRVVPFLNDNLEIGQYFDIEDFITNVTDAHWRRDRLVRLEADNQDIETRLEEKIGAVDRQLAGQSDALLQAMAEEVDALRTYLSKITGLMEELSDRSVVLEQMVGQSIDNAASFDAMVEGLPDQFAELAKTRREVQDAIWTDHQNSQSFTDLATKNIRSIRANIERLKQELKRYD